MVKRVFGKIDGIDATFQSNGDRWQVLVPFDIDGEYIVEIMAEDEAGNVSYVTKMLFVVNKNVIRSYMIPDPFYAELYLPLFSTLMLLSYEATLQKNIYQAYIFGEQFTAELLR
jgi:hypothetical protein